MFYFNLFFKLKTSQHEKKSRDKREKLNEKERVVVSKQLDSHRRIQVNYYINWKAIVVIYKKLQVCMCVCVRVGWIREALREREKKRPLHSWIFKYSSIWLADEQVRFRARCNLWQRFRKSNDKLKAFWFLVVVFVLFRKRSLQEPFYICVFISKYPQSFNKEKKGKNWKTS